MLQQRLGVLIFLGLIPPCLNGCGDNPVPGVDSGAPKVELKADIPKDAPKPKTVPPKPALFRECVLLEPPDAEMRPPDETMAGKNVAKMYEAISTKGGLWESIPFATPEGKKIRYTAAVKTDLGTIELELFSDEAPNHVRNFIALAKAGYYDGLCFHRSLRQESMGEIIALLEAGCPKGTGEVGYGSIGYWLKPEVHPKHQHEEGTIGAWYAERPEAAACKFYVTLCRAPWMDGNYTIFGKIVGGLDVARIINGRPVHDDAFKDRPVEPVIIREVVVHSKILD